MVIRCLFVLLVQSLLISSVQAQSAAEKATVELQKLRELNQTLSAPEYVGRNPDADLDAVKNLPKIREHLQRLAKDFATEIKAGNQPFRDLGTTIPFIGQRLDQFEQAAKAYGSVEAINEDLAHVAEMAKRAIENQAPAYFNSENDIALRTASAAARMRYLEALQPDSEALKAAKKVVAESAKTVQESKAKLSEEILNQNPLPPDDYQGPDRETLIKLLQDLWAKQGTKGKVLKVGIVTADWNRSVSWEIQNLTLYKLDRSRIQGYVIVSHDQKVAVRHSINLVKDHISGDKITASFLNDPKAAPDLGNMILLSKVK